MKEIDKQTKEIIGEREQWFVGDIHNITINFMELKHDGALSQRMDCKMTGNQLGIIICRVFREDWYHS